MRPTRLGMHVGFIALFAVLGGALRGLNLLVILAGLLLGLLLIQWRVCLRSIEGVRLRRQLPREAVAGVPFEVRFAVRNVARWIPGWLLAVDETIAAIGGSEPVGRPPTAAQGHCGVAFLPPRANVQTGYECLIPRRGCYRFGPATLSSGFPFGLIVARRIAAAPASDSLYVYPRLLQLKPGWRASLDARSGAIAATRSHAAPSEGEFYGLRDWQHGDSRRWIHWRTTARTDHPAVRQFERQRRYEMCIVVDAAVAGEGPEEEWAAERAISLAATFVTHMSAIPGSRLTLVAAGRQIQRTLVNNSRESVNEALRTLAELQVVAAPRLAAALAAALGGEGGRNRPVLILSPRTANRDHLVDAPPAEPRSARSSAAPPATGWNGSRPWRGSLGNLDLRWLDVRSEAAHRMVSWETADATA